MVNTSKKKTQTKEVGPITPKMRNRWSVEFEAELGMDTFALQSVSQIRYDPSNGGWQPIEIDFIEITERSSFASLIVGMMNGGLQKPIMIHSLDGSGNKGSRITIAAYKVLSVMHDGLDYGNDNLVMSHLLIQPLKIEF